MATMNRTTKLERLLRENEDPAKGYKQFTIDWIEEVLDRIEDWRDRKPLPEADFLHALQYEADNIWQIIRPVNDHTFFGEVWELLSKLTHAADAKTRRRRMVERASLN